MNRKKIQGITLAVLMVVSVFAFVNPAAAATSTDVTLTPDDASVTEGEQTQFDVVVGEVDGGVGAYDLELNLNNTNAVITDVTLEVEGAMPETEISDDGTTANVSTFGADTNDSTTDLNIVTVTVEGVSEGTTSLDLTANGLSDEAGSSYDVTVDEPSTIKTTLAAKSTNVTLTPDDESVTEGEQTQFDVVVDEVEGGVGAYDVELSLNNTNVEITDLALSVKGDSSTTSATIADDNSSARVVTALADTEDSTTNLTLLTVTVEGLSEGTSELDLTVYGLGDEVGLPYDVSVDEPSTIETTPAEESTNVSLIPDNVNFNKGQSTQFSVVVEEVDGGVGTYDVNLNLNNSNAKFTDISLEVKGSDAFTEKSISDDGSSAHAETLAADTEDSTNNLTLLTVTLEGVSEGASELDLTVTSLGDEAGSSYDYTVDKPTTIQIDPVEAPDVTGEGDRAKDLDGDGLYEDVNGDDSFDLVDVQALYQNWDSDVVQDNAALFDFNGDSVVNLNDVQALYSMQQEA
jgi:hypothetical protein